MALAIMFIITIAFLAGSTAVFGRKLAAQYASLSYPADVVLIL